MALVSCWCYGIRFPENTCSWKCEKCFDMGHRMEVDLSHWHALTLYLISWCFVMGENHLNQTEKYAWQDRKDELIPRSVLTGWAKKTARGISHFDLFPQFSPLRSLLSVSPARHLATLARAEHCGVRMNFCNYRNGGETTNCWNNFVLTSRSASQTKLFQTYPNIKETRRMYPYH